MDPSVSKPICEPEDTYAILASSPPVIPSEVETAERAVEVVIMWGERSVLHVQHVASEGSFWIGEGGQASGSAPDWLLGAETLGATKMPVVLPGAAGPRLLIPRDATGWVASAKITRTFEDLERAGELHPSTHLLGAREYDLPDGATARVEHRAFVFLVRPVAAAKKVGVGFSAMLASIDLVPMRYLAGAFVTGATLLTMMYFAPPSQASLSIDRLDDSSRLVSILMQANETFAEPDPADFGGGEEGGGSERADGEAGEAGQPDKPETGRRLGIRGTSTRNMPRPMEPQDVREVGVLAALGALARDMPVSSVFGSDHYQGRDPMSAVGVLMGDTIGASGGFWGLAPEGTGRGGGGDAGGTIGYGGNCTVGLCPGRGDRRGPGTGYGSTRPMLGGGRTAKGPGRLRPGPVTISPGLSKETIRRIVRRHHNEVRYCYEQELQSQPDLSGRVSVQFVIAPSGAVMSAAVQRASTNLPNVTVQQCVARAVQRWPFPQPENGSVVSVTYPFIFQAR